MNKKFSLAEALGMTLEGLQEIQAKNTERYIADEKKIQDMLDADLQSITPERQRLIDKRLELSLRRPPIMPTRGDGY